MAERGLQGATVRAIALRAGVTAGLIRHYFPGKEDLSSGGLRDHHGPHDGAGEGCARHGTAPDPRRRLAAFVEANLEPPVIDARVFSLWASFIGRVHADPALAAAHREGYLGFRDELEALVAEVLAATGSDNRDKAELRRYAIAINAIIDGLWIEGCLAGEFFEPANWPTSASVRSKRCWASSLRSRERRIRRPLHPLRQGAAVSSRRRQIQCD